MPNRRLLTSCNLHVRQCAEITKKIYLGEANRKKNVDMQCVTPRSKSNDKGNQAV